MKERPILFSGPMVRAILEGRKTQTRRIVKPQPELAESFSQQYPPDGPRTSYGFSGWYPSGLHPRAKHYGSYEHLRKGLPLDFCRYGYPGDRLWVKETFVVFDGPAYGSGESDEVVVYAADHGGVEEKDRNFKYRPSIFMPRWASRITLEITEVRVQRLQEISEEDAKAEGVYGGCIICGDSESMDCVEHTPSYIDGFAHVWYEINGEQSWHENPWVWAVSFREVSA